MNSLRTLTTELGAIPQPDGTTRFLVWAPKFSRVDLRLLSSTNEIIPMTRLDRGYWGVSVDCAPPGTRYFFRFDDLHEWPDPSSRSQPDGVHAASEVVDPSSFHRQDEPWHAPSLEDYVIYEAHIGTFTPEGTFEAAIEQLDRLKQLGVTAFEIMPIAEFPGRRDWGYDGAYPFAAQSSYGGPVGFAKLVDACHERGMSVILDVVYNHFGPEGAYAAAIGNYLGETDTTPWGSAMNFDGSGSEEVRRFFIESAVYWLRDLRVDAFRLDAVHAVFDRSDYPFLREITREVHLAALELGRTVYLIAESDLNDPRMIQPSTTGGYGFDAQWSDDLHHAVHARLTGEAHGYYGDFGSTAEIRRAFQYGFAYTGQFSRHRGRSHGAMPRSVHPWQFVVCAQNHDQVGNRATGERLTGLLDFAQLKLVAATIILSPFTPLLFMGEEYGETAPFQYFTSFSEPTLIEAVRRGRKNECQAFGWPADIPDPQDPSTFNNSRIDLDLRQSGPHATLEAFYTELIRLRRTLPSLRRPALDDYDVDLLGPDESVVALQRRHANDEALILFNLSQTTLEVVAPGRNRDWRLMLDSSAVAWEGSNGDTPDHVASGARLSIPGSAAMLFTATAQGEP